MKKLIIAAAAKLLALVLVLCVSLACAETWVSKCAGTKAKKIYRTEAVKKVTEYSYDSMDFVIDGVSGKYENSRFTWWIPHYKDSTGGKNYKVGKTSVTAGRPEAEDYSFGSVKLSWDKVSGAYGYEVGARSLDKDKNAETSYTNWRYMHTSATSCTVNGLDLSERFKFRVRAVRRVKSGKAYLYYYGPWSDAVAVKMPKGATGVDVKVGETKSDIYTFYNTFTQETEPCTVKSGDFTFSYCSDYRKVEIFEGWITEELHNRTTYDREGTYFVKNVKEEPTGIQIAFANNSRYSSSGEVIPNSNRHKRAHYILVPKDAFTTKTAVWKSTLSARYNKFDELGYPRGTTGSKKTVTQDVTVHTFKISASQFDVPEDESWDWGACRLYIKYRCYYGDINGECLFGPWVYLSSEDDKYQLCFTGTYGQGSPFEGQ